MTDKTADRIPRFSRIFASYGVFAHVWRRDESALHIASFASRLYASLWSSEKKTRDHIFGLSRRIFGDYLASSSASCIVYIHSVFLVSGSPCIHLPRRVSVLAVVRALATYIPARGGQVLQE